MWLQRQQRQPSNVTSPLDLDYNDCRGLWVQVLRTSAVATPSASSAACKSSSLSVGAANGIRFGYTDGFGVMVDSRHPNITSKLRLGITSQIAARPHGASGWSSLDTEVGDDL